MDRLKALSGNSKGAARAVAAMAPAPQIKSPARPDPEALRLDARFRLADELARLQSDDERAVCETERALAARALSEPAVRAATAIHGLDRTLEINALVDELREQVGRVQVDDLRRPESMLVAQAHTLDALFASLVRRATSNMGGGSLEAADRYMRLALRAQAQTVRTIEALGELKNPRAVAFVKQTNIAHNQQVNNGTTESSRARESENRPNELLEQTHGNPLDCGKAAETGRTDSDLAALAARHRPADGRG